MHWCILKISFVAYRSICARYSKRPSVSLWPGRCRQSAEERCNPGWAAPEYSTVHLLLRTRSRDVYHRGVKGSETQVGRLEILTPNKSEQLLFLILKSCFSHSHISNTLLKRKYHKSTCNISVFISITIEKQNYWRAIFSATSDQQAPLFGKKKKSQGRYLLLVFAGSRLLHIPFKSSYL